VVLLVNDCTIYLGLYSCDNKSWCFEVAWDLKSLEYTQERQITDVCSPGPRNSGSGVDISLLVQIWVATEVY